MKTFVLELRFPPVVKDGLLTIFLEFFSLSVSYFEIDNLKDKLFFNTKF